MCWQQLFRSFVTATQKQQQIVREDPLEEEVVAFTKITSLIVSHCNCRFFWKAGLWSATPASLEDEGDYEAGSKKNLRWFWFWARRLLWKLYRVRLLKCYSGFATPS